MIYFEDIFVLNSPILTNSQFKKFNKIYYKKIKIIDCTFDINSSLKERIDLTHKLLHTRNLFRSNVYFRKNSEYIKEFHADDFMHL